MLSVFSEAASREVKTTYAFRIYGASAPAPAHLPRRVCRVHHHHAAGPALLLASWPLALGPIAMLPRPPPPPIPRTISKHAPP